MISRISLFHVDFIFAVFVTIQTEMGTLQHLIVVIGFHDVNPIGEADDRIPWGKSGTALVIAVRIVGEFQPHIILKVWTSRIVGRQIIQRCLVSQGHLLSIGIFLFLVKVRELLIHDGFHILNNHLEGISSTRIRFDCKLPFF